MATLHDSRAATGRRFLEVSEVEFENLEASISEARGWPNATTARTFPPLEMMPPVRDDPTKVLVNLPAWFLSPGELANIEPQEIPVDDYQGRSPLPLPAVGKPVARGMVYQWEGGYLKCYQTHNRTEHRPDTVPALFGPARAKGDPWIQPTGAHDAYPLSALVRHNDQLWISLIANNVWEPGGVGTSGLWSPQAG